MITKCKINIFMRHSTNKLNKKVSVGENKYEFIHN